MPGPWEDYSANAADWETLRETPEKRKQNALNAVRVMEGERGNPSMAADPAALEREISRTRAIAGLGPNDPLPDQPIQVAQKPVAAPAQDEGPWKDFAQAASEDGPWKDYKPKEAGYLAAAKAGFPVAWGNLKETLGGMIRQFTEPTTSPIEGGEGAVPFGQEAYSQLAQTSSELRKQELETGKPTFKPGEEPGAALYKAGAEDIKAATPENLNFGQRAVLNAVSSTLTMAPALAASVIAKSPAPALAAAGAMQLGQSYGEVRQEAPKISPEQAAGHAYIDAAAETIFEYLPDKFLVEHAAGPVLKTFVGQLLREVPSEAVTQAVQSANAKISTQPDMTLDDYMMSIADAAASAAIATPLLTAGGKVMSPLQRKVEPAEQDGIPLKRDFSQDNWPTQAENGLNNPPLSSPNFDFPTAQLDAKEQDALQTQAAEVAPESITPEQATAAKETVAAYENTIKAPPNPHAEMAWSQLSTAPTSPMEDASELGTSTKQAANAENYLNPNTQDRLDRPITFSTDEGSVGLTPRQVMPKPGVYTLGIPSEDRPAPYLAAYQETMAKWQQEFMPDATIVLSNEQLWSNSALGWHYTTGPQGHMIVPATVRLRNRSLDEFNRNAQVSAFYNATHEFGHALIEHSFFQEVPDDVVAAVRDQGRAGVISPEVVTKLPAPQAAVVQEFNALKQALLDNTLTAEQFVQQWMGPAKIARKTFLEDLKVAPNAPAQQLVQAIARRAADRSNITNERSKEAVYNQQLQDFTSLEEYMAEQMARHAYKQNWDKGSPLGQFFSKALQSLRTFFVAQKRDQVIAPGTAFADWVKGLSRTEQALEAKRLQKEAAKQAGKKAVTKAAPKAKAAAVAAEKVKKVKKTEANAKSNPLPRQQQKARGLVTSLIRQKVIAANDENYKSMLAAIKRGDFEDFIEQYSTLSGKTVKFELGDADRPMPSVGRFDSPEFKAWFGDWENDPKSASKARIGIVRLQGGAITLDLERPSEPLVAFANLAKLQQGQNYFHASTTLGQHYEDATNPLAQGVQEKGLVPVVLNIKNPYVVEPDQAHAPSRAELQAQGYDGILYLNDLDGDSSWVVFSPDQVRTIKGRSPYSGRTFMELNHDSSQPEGEGNGKLFRGIKDFLKDSGGTRKSLRWANKIANAGLQMQHLAHIHPEISELSFWSKANLYYNLYKSSRQSEPNTILRDWEAMPFNDQQKVTKFLLDEFQGGEHWFALNRGQKTVTEEGREATIPWYEFKPNERTLQKFAEYGIDLHTDKGRRVGEMISRLKNNMHLDKLNEDERIMRRIGAHRYTNPQTYNAYIQGLAYDVHQLRLKPWIPQTRFGKFIMTIEKKNQRGKYEIVHNEGFESQGELEAAVEKAKAAARPDERVQGFKKSERTMAMLSLPRDFVDVAASELNLTEEQVGDLMDVLQPIRKEKLLSDYDLKRLGITGYSKDLMRSYANHAWHHANLQAKMLYRTQFKMAEGLLQQRIVGVRRTGDVATTIQLQNLLEHMQDTTEYVMNPPNEMYLARALVTYIYLWGNIKTAALNMSGLMTTWTSAAERFGAMQGEIRLAKAVYRTGMSTWLSKGQTLPMPPQLQKALDRAVKEGVLSQSYAYHLSGYANRTVVPKRSQRFARHFIDLGMFPFRLVELMTRRTSFLLEMEAALEKNQNNFEAAYEEAVRRTNLTQNDYSLGNRIKLMRGTRGRFGGLLPMMTIFGSFTQHMSFHTLGGFELGERRAAKLEANISGTEYKGPAWYNSYTGRLALLLFAVGGMEGLPLMENFLDLAEFFWRKTGHPIPLRQYIREFVQSINTDPWMIARGLGHNIAGFDISRSVGMGRIIPGTDVLAKNADGSFAEDTGNAILDAAGVFGGFLKWIAEVKSAIGSGDWMRAGTKAPGEIGNMFNAYDWTQHGVRGPAGGIILRDENGVARDPTTSEIYGKALGFNPTTVSEEREIIYQQHDQRMFWTNKRKDLIDEYKRAFVKDDREALAQAQKKIDEHNSWLTSDYPDFQVFRIKPSDLARDRRMWRRGARAEEMGDLPGKKNRSLGQSVRRSFERPQGGD